MEVEEIMPYEEKKIFLNYNTIFIKTINQGTSDMQILEKFISHMPSTRKSLENGIHQNQGEKQQKGKHETKQTKKSTKKRGKGIPK